ncbi:GTP-binding protein (plasmid) [Azospirillum argentinense]|uniref:GTP-binding protein n=1 Tax=Azospirillum argentinense TaxID=2970906 RepID=A0A2K1FR59_9PROT|nr:GTPase [Azospirillum argentinense]PNQ95023.1 GTP-binding protein [Azospirillum argentinense]
MGKAKHLNLTDVIHRALIVNPGDVEPLVNYLGMDRKTLSFEKGQLHKTAEALAKYLQEMGSNDIATFFRGGGVEYTEVVLDVAEKLGAKDARDDKTVEENEGIILRKLFADALDQMSVGERRQLFSSMGIRETEIPYGSAGTILVQLLLKNFGGFATYRISLIVANMVARTLLGSGLSFATNAALTRTIGTLLGPIGWAASAAWLVVDLAGPAYRKTVPAVVHVAMLRQMLMNRINIGVVGHGSTGKDSLVKAVFGVDTGNVHPVAGSTVDAKIYELGTSGAVHLVNYPGFNDASKDVDERVLDMLPYTDVFLMVVDLSRGVSGLDVSTLDSLKEFGRPILVCLNKADLPRPKDREALLQAARDRLQGVEMVETAFDPDPRLGVNAPMNCRAVYEWVLQRVSEDGKETSHIPKSEHV